ncbi:MAG: hypothetical protein PHT88_05490 [Candidatus Moranbacteria bacterium]|nr:hypothetical protein [Candidatus Moranbacteria bacterium]
MKNGNEKTVFVVQSGSGEHGMLSEEGKRQMEALKEYIGMITLGEYKTTDVRRLLVNFSVLHVASASILHLRKGGESYFVMEPPDFQKTKKVLRKETVLKEQKLLESAFGEMMGLASHWNASVIVIVAQGPVAIVLAEIAYKKFTGCRKDLGEGLGFGAGLCIIPKPDSSCGIVSISSGGIIPLLL